MKCALASIFLLYLFNLVISNYALEDISTLEVSENDSKFEWYRPNRIKRQPQRQRGNKDGDDDDSEVRAGRRGASSGGGGGGGGGGGRGNRGNKKCRGLDGFRCSTGSNCIPLEKLCDGKPDCTDASDESYMECKDKKCGSQFFKCAYGACVRKEARCNGQKECYGGSDEVGCKSKRKPKPENVVCTSNEFKCKSGECIRKKQLCNGRPNCKDKSDETNALCSAKICTETQFKCTYGACIDLDRVCDGFRDCEDRSDETEAACSEYAPQIDVRVTENGGCILPPIPENGAYTLNGQQATPGENVPSNTVLLFTCMKGYQIRPITSSILYCDSQSIWNTEPPKCVVECPRLISSSMDIVYSRNGLLIDQTEALLPNTVATLKCKHSYRPPSTDPNYRDLACEETGSWNRPLFSCSPVCGTEIPDGQPLIINGEDVKSGEFPWNVGIYRSDKNTIDYQHICGGTIISPRIIISAAHCFYDEATQKVFDLKYAIGAGKYYRQWTTEAGQDPYAQLKEVLNYNIRIPNEYKGSRTSYRSDIALLILDPIDALVMSDLVRPACIDWDQSSESQALQEGNLGKVAGWGKTQEDGLQSDTLKLLTLPFIPTFPTCFESVPESFQPYLQEDKICAGYLNGSSVCEGDSGGGLVFKNPSTKLWFLRAIVSIDPIKGNNCDSHSYTGFTRFSFHLQWARSLYALIA